MDPKDESPHRPKTLKSVSRKEGLSINLMKEKNNYIFAKVTNRNKNASGIFKIKQNLR